MPACGDNAAYTRLLSDQHLHVGAAPVPPLRYTPQRQLPRTPEKDPALDYLSEVSTRTPPSSLRKLFSISSNEDDEEDEEHEDAEAEARWHAPLVTTTPASWVVCWASFMVMLPGFSAYAALFSMQGEVKRICGIPNDSSAAAHLFSFATSFLYIFNCLFRLLHHILFNCVSSRSRVYIAIGSLIASMSILSLVSHGELQPGFSYVFTAYALGGAGIGSFETNVLSSLTFLGHTTKKYATFGVPSGVCFMQIGGFLFLQMGVPVDIIYVAVIVGLVSGAFVLCFVVPAQPASGPESIREQLFPDSPQDWPRCKSPGRSRPNVQPRLQKSRSQLINDLRCWKEWLPKMWTLPLPMAADMLCLSIFAPGVLLFIYDDPQIALFGPPLAQNEFFVPKHVFFAIYNAAMALGGVAGRYIGYHLHRTLHPAFFVPILMAGAALNIFCMPGVLLSNSGIPLLAPIAAALIYFGDGLIYSTICRSIDETVPKAYNLVAVSLWLFIGDLGSVTGSNLIPFIRDALAAV